MKTNERLAVVVPSYNSASTIKLLVEGLVKKWPQILVLVVDDNSPDGTAEIVGRLCYKYPNLLLKVRPKKGGRGTAVIEGFKYFLQNKDVELFVEMDADLSHLPEELSRLVDGAKKYDVVIGSRYVKGSQIVGWPLSRRLFSPLANWWARLVLGVPISDYTNGYRLYHRQVIEKMEFDQIRSCGFAVLSEMIFQIHQKGFSIGDVPTTFNFEKRQQSSFSLSEIREAFLTVIKIRLNHGKWFSKN